MPSEPATQQQVKNLAYELDLTTLLIANLIAHIEKEGLLPQAITGQMLAVCEASHKRLKQLEQRTKREGA